MMNSNKKITHSQRSQIFAICNKNSISSENRKKAIEICTQGRTTSLKTDGSVTYAEANSIINLLASDIPSENHFEPPVPEFIPELDAPSSYSSLDKMQAEQSDYNKGFNKRKTVLALASDLAILDGNEAYKLAADKVSAYIAKHAKITNKKHLDKYSVKELETLITIFRKTLNWKNK